MRDTLRHSTCVSILGKINCKTLEFELEIDFDSLWQGYCTSNHFFFNTYSQGAPQTVKNQVVVTLRHTLRHSTCVSTSFGIIEPHKIPGACVLYPCPSLSSLPFSLVAHLLLCFSFVPCLSPHPGRHEFTVRGGGVTCGLDCTPARGRVRRWPLGFDDRDVPHAARTSEQWPTVVRFS